MNLYHINFFIVQYATMKLYKFIERSIWTNSCNFFLVHKNVTFIVVYIDNYYSTIIIMIFYHSVQVDEVEITD